MENKIRIQPGIIEIPKNSPFEHDLLNRKTAVGALTNVISNIEGPCVMAVDAPWGMGKTTFIRMWEQYLRDGEFLVASFNAWKTDYFTDPFSALSTELMQVLEGFEESQQEKRIASSLSKRLETLATAIRAVPRKTLPVLIRSLSDVTDGGLAGIVVAQIFETCAAKDANDQKNTREALETFRNSLGEMASALIEETEQRPLVIIIDELDRCRPSYAIELLEIAKHFFSVDHVVFVLAINRTELSHSVRALYGAQFNANAYLERFFDIDFKLPDTNKEKFIQSSFQAMKINQYFKRTEDKDAEGSFPTIAKVFSAFLGQADISLRTISQVVRRLGLVIAALPNDRPFLGWGSAIALIIRTIDLELYEKFISQNVDDGEVIDSILSRSEFANFKNRHEGNLFEAVIITAHMELRARGEPQIDTPSPRYEQYDEWAKLGPEADIIGDKEGPNRAVKIRKMIDVLRSEAYFGRGVHFLEVIERIELFSTDLAQEDTSQK